MLVDLVGSEVFCASGWRGYGEVFASEEVSRLERDGGGCRS